MGTHGLIDAHCSRHGLARHVCVHEAGHAVAALDNGVPFRAVVFYDDATAPRFTAGLARAAAAVDAGPDASAWVMADPLGSLRFVMGGVAAELAVLGDCVPGGWGEDIKVWRRGSNMTEQQTEQGVAEFIGQPMPGVWEECRAWAKDNVARIEAIAATLEGHDAPWELPSEAVEEILGGM